MTEKITFEMVLHFECDGPKDENGWNSTLTDLKQQITRAIISNIDDVQDIELHVTNTEKS